MIKIGIKKNIKSILTLIIQSSNIAVQQIAKKVGLNNSLSDMRIDFTESA